MASPVGRLYSAASSGNMDSVIQKKGVNSGILSRKPLLDRPVNSKSPSLTAHMNKIGSIGKQNTNKLSFPSMAKQSTQVHLTVEEEGDLDAEEFMFSFEEVEDEFWSDKVNDMAKALEFLKPHFGNFETPPPSPQRNMKLEVSHIDSDLDFCVKRQYVWQEETNNLSFDVDIPEFNDPEYELIV